MIRTFTSWDLGQVCGKVSHVYRVYVKQALGWTGDVQRAAILSDPTIQWAIWRMKAKLGPDSGKVLITMGIGAYRKI